MALKPVLAKFSDIDFIEISSMSAPDFFKCITRLDSQWNGYISCPAIMSVQDNRPMFSIHMEVRFLTKLLIEHKNNADSGTKGKMPSVRADVLKLKKYFIHNNDFIIPPLTISISDKIAYLVDDINSFPLLGKLCMSLSSVLHIVDGQKRILALLEALEELAATNKQKYDRISSSHIVLTIFHERREERIVSDFLECNQCVSVPEKYLTGLTKGTIVDDLFKMVLDSCLLFKNRVDFSSKTMSIRSMKLLLASQLRTICMFLIFGRAVEKEEELLFEGNKSQTIQDCLIYINALATGFPEYYELITEKTSKQSKTVSKYKKLQMIHFSYSGLLVLAEIEYNILKKDKAGMDVYIKKLVHINWTREGDIWKQYLLTGNRVSPGRPNTCKCAEILMEKNRASVNLMLFF